MPDRGDISPTAHTAKAPTPRVQRARVVARDAVSDRARPSWGFSNATEHQLVQRRIGTLYGLVALLLGGVFLLGSVAIAIESPALLIDLEISKLTYLIAIAVLAGTWGLCRATRVNGWILAIVDAGSLLALVALLSVTSAYAGPGVHVEHLGASVFALVVPLRAALVPAPPMWCAIVSLVGAVPLPIAAYATMPHAVDHSGPFPRILGVVMVVAWCAAGVVAAGTISRLVYGLRTQIRSAMHFGQYTLEEKIGEGGMGVVYRARHAMLRRPTALKLLPTTSADSESSKRFEREVQLTSGLTHPNTIVIYDYGHTLDGVFYYAMELLDGFTLAQVCQADGPQVPGRVVHILSQAARALAEAHSVGLVHRDVKPENIFLCVRGGVSDFVKVLDFGLVKEVHSAEPSVSAANDIAGTPLYMAPETIVSPDEVDGRVDIYALGTVGYFLLTGTTPFAGGTVAAVAGAQLYEQPRPPSERLGRPIPRELEALLMQCLAKSPSDRPASADELADRLDALRSSLSWDQKDAVAWWRACRLSRMAEREKRHTTAATVRVRAPGASR